MKKIGSILLALSLLAVLFTVCAPDKPADDPANEKLRVVATIFPQYDFLRSIAGGNIELSMLLSPGSESHSFEPTPQDIIKIQNCDMFVYVGGESDVWIDDILASMDVSKKQIVSLMDLVDTVEEELLPGMEDDHGHEEEHEEPELDEHVWTAPKNAAKIVQALSDKLCTLDADNAETYKQNTTACLAKLDTLDKAFRAAVDGGSRKTLVFADRFPFRYFADSYGLTPFAAFPGCATETQASASTVTGLIDKVKAEKIPVVFTIEFSDGKLADTICEATDAKKLQLHSCHNISKADFDSGLDYLSLMTQNVENLKEALK